MLARNSSSKAYVHDCRISIDAHLAVYRALRPAPPPAFVRLFFNNLVVVLDRMFVHRTRGREDKDGNPLNEVRMLCDSILEAGAILAANNTIRCDLAASVAKLAVGSEIVLTEAQFKRLADAYFAEIEAKFT